MAYDEQLEREVLTIIRAAGQDGYVLRLEEIEAELRELESLDLDTIQKDSVSESVLESIRNNAPDIQVLNGLTGTSYYYCSKYLTETYARILVDKGEDPLVMIAEAVRENSRLYPRPIPISQFQGPPFDLTPEAAEEFLHLIENLDEFHDIDRTATSVGTIFLYSKKYLEPDHASMIAEWLDVGQADSP